MKPSPEHVCYGCFHRMSPTPSNSARADWCSICGHRGWGQLRDVVKPRLGLPYVVPPPLTTKKPEPTKNPTLMPSAYSQGLFPAEGQDPFDPLHPTGCVPPAAKTTMVAIPALYLVEIRQVLESALSAHIELKAAAEPMISTSPMYQREFDHHDAMAANAQRMLDRLTTDYNVTRSRPA
jgi:hypothetical protein